MTVDLKRRKCPDCQCCQTCGKNRCRLCHEKGHEPRVCELEPGFTYGAYLEWKKRRQR